MSRKTILWIAGLMGVAGLAFFIRMDNLPSENPDREVGFRMYWKYLAETFCPPREISSRSFHSPWYRYTFTGDRITKQQNEPRPFPFKESEMPEYPVVTEELTPYELYCVFSGDRGFDLQSFDTVIRRIALQEKEIFVVSGISRWALAGKSAGEFTGLIFYKILYSGTPVKQSIGFILCQDSSGAVNNEQIRGYRLRPVPAELIMNAGNFNHFSRFSEDERKTFTTLEPLPLSAPFGNTVPRKTEE